SSSNASKLRSQVVKPFRRARRDAPLFRSSICFGEVGDLSGRSGQFYDLHAVVVGIDEIDVTAVVHVQVVRVGSDLARLIGLTDAFRHAVGSRNVKADFFRMQRVANIDGADAGVVMGDEKNLIVINRSEVLVGGVRAEIAAAGAEVAAFLRNGEGGHAH